tara:strand:- start:347 stop:637 length:291 start_codon:yes stop_codon:yes gene_type:complete
MSKKILQFIVVFLAILILLCFFTLVYGLYIKIGKKQSNLDTKNITYNLNLADGHLISDIDLLNSDKILFTIKNNNETYAIIYDINSKKTIKVEQKK